MNAPASSPRRLESYVCGEWVRGQKEGQTLLDAATGEPVAQIDSTGIDFAAVLDHGRKIAEGNPDFVRSHPDVISAYLGRGERHRA